MRSVIALRRAGLAALVFSSLLALSCGRPRKSSDDGPKLTGSGHVAVLNLRAGVPEAPLSGGLFPLPAGRTHTDLMLRLKEMKSDEDVQAVFVRLGPGLGYYRAAELGNALAALGEDTPVVCHAHAIDNASLWFSKVACDETWVSAAGDVSTVGIGAELTYIKGALDKLGVKADMMAMGKYKSGAESLTRTEPSPDSLRNLKETLANLRSQWLKGVATGAKNPEAQKAHAEDGPWVPERAVELGLVSHVGFEDEALTSAKEKAGVEETQSVYGARDSRKDSPAAELVRLLAGGGERSGGKRRIAVVPAVGGITMAPGGPFSGGEGITAAALTRTFKRLREDDSVRAIVLRIDSPGGSPLASDLIWREMMLTRQQKPVIVSIGGMAASGGYYLASAGTRIVASPSAIVGSIGVFGGKIVIGDALAKFGVTSQQVGASDAPGAAARATHMSALSAWDEPTRERVRASMQRIYDLFIDRVAEGRGIDEKRVYATAEGAIFLATTGKERGLIDELGGVERALEIARKEASLPEDVRITIEGGGESLMEALLLGPAPSAAEVEAALLRYQSAQAHKAALLGPEFMEALRPMAAAVEPMLAGESVVAALPFGVTIR